MARSNALPAADAVVRDYLDHLQFERGLSPNTVAAYERDLRGYTAFLAAHGRAPLAARAADVNAYFDGQGGDGAATSVARRMAAVRGLYRYLVREERITADPAALLQAPKRPQQLPAVLSVEEVEAVLARVVPGGALGQRDLALFELLYGCGLRASELVGLREGDVDLEGGLVRCLGKGGKERVVPMGRPAAEAVRRYLRDGRRTLLRGRRREQLFLNARGGPLTRQGLDFLLRRYVGRAGLAHHVSAHTFRHSFATHLLRGGADLRSVQEMLGHANVATTQLYTHVTVEHLREVFLETHPRARRRGAQAAEDGPPAPAENGPLAPAESGPPAGDRAVEPAPGARHGAAQGDQP
jgi:integrase/recombinase XerD